MRKRVLVPLLVLLLVAGALALLISLRKNAPPEAARLLPESDAIVYINLKPVRMATHYDQNPVKHDADYQQFIDGTGIEFERDLDEVAFAVHQLPDATGPQGPVAFSEVFVGKFDGKRVSSYFASMASSTEEYAGHTVYTIPHAGHTVRVATLGYDMIAVANTPDPEQIHHILDRYRTAALPFSGSTLLQQHYSDVPLLSLAWGIGKIGLPFSEDGKFHIFGVALPIPADTTFIASARYFGSVHLRIEEIAPSETIAEISADGVKGFVALFQGEQKMRAAVMGTKDADMDTMVNSTKVEQKKNRAILTTTVPLPLIKRMIDPVDAAKH